MKGGGGGIGRRAKMSDLYSALHSVIPNLSPKATKEQIVTGTISCIESLKEEIQSLERLKKSLPPAAKPACTSSVDFTVSGDKVVFFGVRLVFRRHLATDVFRVFDKHGAEVLAASLSVDDDEKVLVVAVTAFVGGGKDAVEIIKRDIIDL